MLVRDLIKKLETLDQDMEVHISERGGCHECNSEGIDFYIPCDGIEVGERYVDGYRRPSKTVVII